MLNCFKTYNMYLECTDNFHADASRSLVEVVELLPLKSKVVLSSVINPG